MPSHQVIIRWKNHGPGFLKRQYSREHTWHFDGGAVINASPSPLVVPAPWSNAANVDPEEAFVASIAGCHMLWFLHVAIDAGWTVESYEDEATGAMGKDADGKWWMESVTLRPKVVWASGKEPDSAEVAQLHHLAHEACFIANSIRTVVSTEPRQ